MHVGADMCGVINAELERHDTRTPCKPADTIVEDDFNPELLDMSENLDIEARGKVQDLAVTTCMCCLQFC